MDEDRLESSVRRLVEVDQGMTPLPRPSFSIPFLSIWLAWLMFIYSGVSQHKRRRGRIDPLRSSPNGFNPSMDLPNTLSNTLPDARPIVLPSLPSRPRSRPTELAPHARHLPNPLYLRGQRLLRFDSPGGKRKAERKVCVGVRGGG